MEIEELGYRAVRMNVPKSFEAALRHPLLSFLQRRW